MYGYFNRFGNAEAEGVEILKYKISLPYFEGRERMTEFYQRICEQILTFCETELKNFAKEQYDMRADTEVKGRYPEIIYALNGRVTHADVERVFVLIEATLKKYGESERICRRYDAHAWSVEDELLISPKKAARAIIPDGKLPKEVKRAEGIFVSDGRLFSCRGDRICEIES